VEPEPSRARLRTAEGLAPRALGWLWRGLGCECGGSHFLRSRSGVVGVGRLAVYNFVGTVVERFVVALGEIARRLRRGCAGGRAVTRHVAAPPTTAPAPPPPFRRRLSFAGAASFRRGCGARRTARCRRSLERPHRRRRRGRRGFEPPEAPLGKVGACGERLDTQREALHLEADARHLRDQALQHRVVQRVPLRLRALAFGFAARRLAVHPHLRVQRRRNRIGVEEQLEHRRQQLPEEAQQPVVRVVDRVVFERVGVGGLGGRDLGRRAGGLAQLVEQPGLDGARVEDRLETARGQLLNLLCREVDAVALRDARLDLLDDLIDVGLLGRLRVVGLWRRRGAAVATPVGAATAAVEVLAAPGLRMLISCHLDR
jgi:hypothetical protein